MSLLKYPSALGQSLGQPEAGLTGITPTPPSPIPFAFAWSRSSSSNCHSISRPERHTSGRDGLGAGIHRRWNSSERPNSRAGLRNQGARAGGREPAEAEAEAEEFPGRSQGGDRGLAMGSPIVLVKAPELLKTAEPMPMMRANRGLLKPGDAGRVIDQRPKNVWAVRFAVGAYLIDRSCFKPMDSD